MFFPQYSVSDALSKRLRRTIEPVADTVPGCDGCSLRSTWGSITTPKMAVSGNTRNPDILVIGEGPGAEEDAQGKAMVGPSGQLLREHLPKHIIDRCAFVNVVRCRPPSNRTPTPSEAHSCSIYLNADIERLPIKYILGVGAVPLKQFASALQILEIHGLKFPVQVGNKQLWYFPVIHPSYILHTMRENDWASPALPVFKADLARFCKEVDRWPKPRVHTITKQDVYIPKSAQEAWDIAQAMQEPLGFDLESANYKFDTKDVRTANFKPYIYGSTWLTSAFSDGKTTIAFPCNHPHAPNDWGVQLSIDICRSKRWVAHNAAMELLWLLYHGGADHEYTYEDSMAVVRLYFERNRGLALEEVTTILLGINIKAVTGVDAKYIKDHPLEDVLPYNGHDAWGCALAYREAIERVHPQNYERIVQSITATTIMELSGLPTDQEKAYQLDAKWAQRIVEIEQRIKATYEVRQYEADRGVEFNPGSAGQVGVALTAYGRLVLPHTADFGKPGNRPQYVTDDDTLSQYVDTSPLAKEVLEWRTANKNKTTYILPILEVPRIYVDGLAHPSYTTMIVGTYRLSSRDFNIQNWPVRNAEDRELREMIAAEVERSRHEHLLVKFDFGQLEARILAMASRCPNLCRALIERFDIHQHWLDKILQQYYADYWYRLVEIANEVSGDAKKIMKTGRDLIKSDFVFSSLYGSNADTCSIRTQIPLDITREILGEFWGPTYYAVVKKWHKARRVEYDNTGGVALLTGMRRHGILKKGNECINTPIQGTGALIVLDALNEISTTARKTRNPYLHPRIDIHDDLTFILRNDDNLPEYIDYIKDVMLKVRYPWQIVPMTVEVKIGEEWSHLEDVATFQGDYVR